MDWDEFDSMLRGQRKRVTQKLAGMERRIQWRLKAIGMDRKGRAGLTVETTVGECEVHASGPARPRLDQLDQAVGSVWKS